MEKKDIEIPFGAFDSELGGFEYTIPEGYKAEIKDGKVVVRKTESEDEKIRKELIAFLKENHETGRADETWSLSGIERWIAWLEKQGEKGTNGNEREIPNSTWSEENKSYLLDFTRWFEQNAKAYDINLPMRGFDICAFCKEIIERLRICDTKKCAGCAECSLVIKFRRQLMKLL